MATTLVQCLTPYTAQLHDLSRPDAEKVTSWQPAAPPAARAKERLHRRTVDIPTAPEEGRRRTFSRRYIDWSLVTPILCISGKKASPTCLRGTASCRPPQGRLGSTEDAQPMPTFSQRILPGLPVMSEQT